MSASQQAASRSDCPLCGAEAAAWFADGWRDYLRCGHCALVFVHPSQLPSPEAERRHYDLHDNHADDPGYRRFLSRAMQPVLENVTAPAEGLDFGCGPGPTLSVMLREAGYVCADYDPLYFPDKKLLCGQYDFVTCTEVIEHVHRPVEVWSILVSLLNPGGLLVVMSKRVRDREAFANWHYRRDPTHVSFYSEATFDWVARQFGLSPTFCGDDVVTFFK